jgi:hypothetical protein
VRVTRTPPAAERTVVVPDGARQLSDGFLIEASVVARLFRIRLLTLDASLVVVPAQAKGATRVAAAPRAIGGGLAAAERFLDEGAASLAASRAMGRQARRPSGEGGIRTLGRG